MQTEPTLGHTQYSEQRSVEQYPRNQRVTLVDLDVPFGRLFKFMFKFTLAAVPAMLVAWFIIYLVIFMSAGLVTVLATL